MTAAEVRDLVRTQASDKPNARNGHGITLGEALVPPEKLSVLERTVEDGQLTDRILDIWLVAAERSPQGYKIIMGDDSLIFGLATNGFPTDRHLVLVGWYGDLFSAFMAM